MRLVCDGCEQPFEEHREGRCLVTVMVSATPPENPPGAMRSEPVNLAYCSGKCLEGDREGLGARALSKYRKITTGLGE